MGPVTVDTEDNMRRKQGPLKVSDVSPEGQQCPTDAGQEYHHAARYQHLETKAASGEHASKDESGFSEAAYDCQSKRDPHPAHLGQPVVRFCPCKVGPSITKLRLKGPPLPMLQAEGGMESSHCSMGSRQSFLSSGKNLDTRRQQ